MLQNICNIFSSLSFHCIFCWHFSIGKVQTVKYVRNIEKYHTIRILICFGIFYTNSTIHEKFMLFIFRYAQKKKCFVICSKNDANISPGTRLLRYVFFYVEFFFSNVFTLVFVFRIRMCKNVEYAHAQSISILNSKYMKNCFSLGSRKRMQRKKRTNT